MNMKILAPVGNFESLKAAVYNGADEVYLGINDFNARNNIDGFNLDNLKEAVDFAHVFGVKVLLAINILFADEEIPSAFEMVVKAYNLGVDAFIVQDLGLIGLISENYPEIELHASTQMGLHNAEGVNALKKFGIKRVVLARETPLEEIKRIKENCKVEIEYFAQGALCVSFSGNCYLSSYQCGASGNRGRCKQLCRLPYTFLKNGKPLKKGYLLSAKDFNLIDRLHDLKNAGVDVIKIEGRARRPFYVAATTKEYYNAIHKKEVNRENLELAFNRNYTPGYFDGNGGIISEIQNHIGVFVGKVEKVNGGKNFNEVFISSSRNLSPKSTFKFFGGGKEKNTVTAFDLNFLGNGKYRLTTTQAVSVGDEVRLINDAKIEDEILSVTKKRTIKLKLFIREGKPLKAVIDLSNATLEVLGEIVERAEKRPLTEDEIFANFKKSEYFSAQIEICALDLVFVLKQTLNEFRRRVFETVYEFLTEKYRRNVPVKKVNQIKKATSFADFQFIEDLNEPLTKTNVIYSPETYDLEDVGKFVEQCKNTGKNAYLDTPNFALLTDVKLLKEIVEKTSVKIVANNYYALGLAKETVIGGGLNVYNSFTASILNAPVISAESNVATRVDFPYMTLRHCPMKTHFRGECKNCPYTSGFAYKTDSGKILRLKRKKMSTCTFYLTD